MANALADYRARVQRVFDTHNLPVMPSGKLLRDCFLNGLQPKSVYQLVKEITSGTPCRPTVATGLKGACVKSAGSGGGEPQGRTASKKAVPEVLKQGATP